MRLMQSSSQPLNEGAKLCNLDSISKFKVRFPQMLLTLANQLFLALIGIIAARALHNAMLHAVLRAPMVFFQSTPLGRLINRFTKDIADVDKNLIQYTAMFLRGFFQLFSTFALIAFLTPFALTVITPLLFAFYMLYLYFQVGSKTKIH